MNFHLVPLEVNLAWSSSRSILSHSGLLTDDPNANNYWTSGSTRLKVFALWDQMVLQSPLLLIIRINAWKNSLVEQPLVCYR